METEFPAEGAGLSPRGMGIGVGGPGSLAGEEGDMEKVNGTVESGWGIGGAVCRGVVAC